MTVPPITVDASGITIHPDGPMSAEEARHAALRLLEAATAPERVIRRRATVDEAFRDREGGV